MNEKSQQQSANQSEVPAVTNTSVPRGTAEYDEFKQLLSNNYATWSSLKIDETARFYAADVVNYDTIPPIEGFSAWKEWTDALRVNLWDKVSSTQFNASDDLCVWRMGDTAWSAFTFRIQVKFKDGRETEINGRQTNIWQRRDGVWLIVHEHASVPMPPGAQTLPARSEARKTATGDAEFERLVGDWFATWSTLAPNAAERFYAKDEGSVFYNLFPPLAGFVGWNNLKEGQLKNFSRIESARFTPYDDLRVWRRGDVAWTTNTFHVSTKSKDGEASEIDARVTLVWVRRGGGWLVVHEHLSTALVG